MWIENRKISFGPFEIKQKGDSYLILAGGNRLELSAQQYRYLDAFIHGESIHSIVQDFLSKGWLVSFREIWSLLENLNNARLIINPEFQAYLNMTKSTLNATGVHELSSYKGQVVAQPEVLKSLPFFRSLHPDLQKIFIKNTSIQSIPERTRICKTGEHTRELFALLDGQVAVYRDLGEGRRQMLSLIPKGGVFGEGGFLLNRPRAADVITMQKSTVLVIQHSPEFDQMIQTGKAETLQRRFWVLHGLLSSDLFSHLPIETLDSLIFAGKIIQAKEGTVLTKEGDPGRSFYIILQGSVAFSQKGKSLRALSQGGIFGEVALLVSGGVRTATAQAQRDSLLIEIDMNEFYEILSNHIFLAKELEDTAWKRWNNRLQ